MTSSHNINREQENILAEEIWRNAEFLARCRVTFISGSLWEPPHRNGASRAPKEFILYLCYASTLSPLLCPPGILRLLWEHVKSMGKSMANRIVDLMMLFIIISKCTFKTLTCKEENFQVYLLTQFLIQDKGMCAPSSHSFTPTFLSIDFLDSSLIT